METFDYIIVGQGIAGSAVAVQLLKRGRKILVIDQPHQNTSSRIAAGLFNPVTGKKMVKTWMADKLFPTLSTFYQDVEARTNSKFFSPLPIYRPFFSIEEQNEWMARSAEPQYKHYIEGVHTKPSYADICDDYGGLLLRHSGVVHTSIFIEAIASWIRSKGLLLHENFDDAGLSVDEDRVRYKNWESSKIIFCTGVHSSVFFQWLPIRALKGETISIKSSFRENIVVNRGVYVLPANERGVQRVGATYNFEDNSDGVTMAARQELSEKLAAVVSFSYDIVDQQFGWRPTTADRRPLLGVHPEWKSVFVFNGLGTKGVSLAPHFSEVLIRWIENELPLDKEVDIERFKSVYWKSPK